MSPRDRILARRAKFMAAAFVGITGCSSESSPQPPPQVCLTGKPYDSGVDARDASDTEPMVCLTAPPPDSAFEDVTDTSDATDATDFDTGAMPCLAPPPDDGG